MQMECYQVRAVQTMVKQPLHHPNHPPRLLPRRDIRKQSLWCMRRMRATQKVMRRVHPHPLLVHHPDIE